MGTERISLVICILSCPASGGLRLTPRPMPAPAIRRSSTSAFPGNPRGPQVSLSAKSGFVRLLRTAMAALTVVGCSQSASLSRQALLDPETCKSCHPDQFNDWAGSMHAYSSTDPVFIAMNRRGQRETSGALGNFCVNCHAPMAVHEGKTTDGLNLDQAEPKLKGLPCFFCHSIYSLDSPHHTPLNLATAA